MRLAWVELRDFRNHALTRIDPVPDGLLVAVGPNGEGKTNLLEGMHFLYALGSPRTSTNAPLVRVGAAAAYVRGEFETRDGRALVEIEIPSQGASKVKVNRSPVRRKRDLRRQVRAVLFGPFDLPIVIGDPSKRRAFMDEAVIALWPVRDSMFTSYDRALRQRNRLLKEWDRPGPPPGIEAWDEELIQAGCAVIRARADAVERLAPFADEEFRAIASYGLECVYAPNLPAADDLEGAFRARIGERRVDELQRRTSLVGPHRDDLNLAVRDLGARAFASYGETWAAALCVRLGLASAVAAEIGEPPLLLIDDPVSALDPRRRDPIGARLAARGGQVLITVADDAHVPANAAAVWDVVDGTITVRSA
ncbi:MAG: DNA replication/repair protein RecF [Actinomycetota bacterium]